jgi:tetratricopeptide (TPR) repeat protein
MSLLMQALKKAEQTKQKQQSDAVLSLSPTDMHAEPLLQTMAEAGDHALHANNTEQAETFLLLDDKAESASITVDPIPAFSQPIDAILENQFVSTPAPVTPDIKDTLNKPDNNHIPEERVTRPRIDIDQVKANINASQAQAAEQQKAKSVFSSKSPQVKERRMWIIAIGGVAFLMLTGFAYVFWQSSQIENRYSQIALIPANPVPPAPPVAAVAATTAASTATVSETNVSPVNANNPPVGLATPSSNSAPAKGTDSKLDTNQAIAKNADNRRTSTSSNATNSDGQARSDAVNISNKTGTPQSQLAKDAQGIQIRKGSSEAQIHPALSNAYQAFLAGDSAKAEQQYQIVLSQEANNRDALIGLAAIALNQRNAEKAGAYYGKLLELDPNDPDAIAGLTSLQQGDPVQSESRLKKALNQHPNAGAILFALGNLYAQQTRWSDAQQSYFRAYTTQTSNADYAYNLAISLDRLNQIKLAKEYYQRALDAGQSGPGNFNRSSVQKRIAELDKAVNDKQ